MDENPNQEYASYPRAATVDPRQYHGPPDFRINAINEAWLIYKSDIGLWFGGYFLILLITMIVTVPGSLYTYWRTLEGGARAGGAIDTIAVTLIAGLLAAAVSGVLHGGYVRIIIQKMRLQHEGFGGMFDVKGQGGKLAAWGAISAAPVLIVSTIYSAYSSQFTEPSPDQIGPMMMALFMFFGASIVLQLLIFPFFLTPMLIVDRKMPLVQAAITSYQHVGKMYFKALGFYIVMAIIAGSGVILCGIGMLFTIPLYQLAIAVAYRDNFMPPLTYTPGYAPPTDPFRN